MVFFSAHRNGLLTERGYAIGLAGISFSFLVSPFLINLGYRLVARFEAGTRPGLPLEASRESIRDHVVVVGYSYVGRVICMMLERAGIAFEHSLDRVAEARREGRTVYFGDATDPAAMDASAISARAR